MEYVELITHEVARVCRESGVEGVRLVPFIVEADEVAPLVESLRNAVGAGLFLAVSAPDATRVESERVWVSPDDDAARQATEWRNTIDSAAGERLVYIAHKRWGRAGGLQDTLRRIPETALREAFRSLAEEHELPAALIGALDDTGVLKKVRSRDLSAFAKAVTAADDPFRAAGEHLPLLGLARDTGLTPGDARERIRFNDRIVHRAIAGERIARSSSQGQITEQLRRAHREDDQGALSAVDLGEATTEELAPRGGSTRRRATSATPVRKKGRKKATKRSTPDGDAAAGSNRAAEREVGSGVADRQAELLNQALAGGAASRGRALSDLGGSLLQESAAATDHSEDAGLEGLFRELREDVQPGALELVSAVVRGDGSPLELEVKEDPRAALRRELPGSVELRPAPLDLRDHATEVARWREARHQLVELLVGAGDRERLSVAGLVRAPLLALSAPSLRAAAGELVEAASDAYRAATTAGEASAARALLAIDTAIVTGADGRRLVLLTPLHPLSLGQALARLEQLDAQRKKLSRSEARVVARTLSRTPAAPQEFPVSDGDFGRLAPPVSGLICFETQPALAQDLALRTVGERLVAAFLSVHPYARLDLRIRIHGEAPAPLLEGLAAALDEEGELGHLEVQTESESVSIRDASAREALSSGHLVLAPLAGEGVGAHLELVVAPTPTGAADDRPGDVDVAGYAAGTLSTNFEVFRGGLRALTEVAGVLGVEEAEAALALARGRAPQGAFVVEPRGMDLQSAVASTTRRQAAWRAVLGHDLSRTHADSDRLICFERLEEGLQVAVLSDTTEPASRTLEAPMRRLGVDPPTPMALRTLAERLCQLGRGLVPLHGSSTDRLASLLLEAALRADSAAQGDACAVARLTGQSLRSLADEQDVSAGGFCIALADSSPARLTVAYAALQDPMEVTVARGGHLQGALADALGGVLESVDAALSDSGVGAACAREALRWALCPAAAEEASEHAASLLERLRSFPCDGQVEVDAVVYLAPGHPLAGRDNPARLKGREVRFSSLDSALLDRLLIG